MFCFCFFVCLFVVVLFCFFWGGGGVYEDTLLPCVTVNIAIVIVGM